ncbi:hypothetical protein ACFE04_024065 [Oxalis oulophora]
MALTLNHSQTRQFAYRQLTTAEEDNTVNSPLCYDDVVSLYNISSNGVMSKKVKGRPTYQNLISDSSNQLNDFLKPSISHSEKCATVKMDGIEEDINRGSSIGTRQDVKVQGSV